MGIWAAYPPKSPPPGRGGRAGGDGFPTCGNSHLHFHQDKPGGGKNLFGHRQARASPALPASVRLMHVAGTCDG